MSERADSAKPQPRSEPRILVNDDNVAIHEDFRKVLCASREAAAEAEFRAAEAALLGETVDRAVLPQHEHRVGRQICRNGDHARQSAHWNRSCAFR